MEKVNNEKGTDVTLGTRVHHRLQGLTRIKECKREDGRGIEKVNNGKGTDVTLGTRLPPQIAGINKD